MVPRFSLWMLAGVLPLAAQPQPLAPGRGVNFYSLEKEAALGTALAQELRRSSAPLDSPGVREYVEHLGGRLAPELRYGAPYTFEVLANAGEQRLLEEPRSLPGGYVFVPAALLLTARDEAEFAGMLAHAMAHISARHPTRAATRGQITNYAAMPLIFMGGWSGSNVPLGFLSVMRQYELDADRLAVHALAGAGLDPGGLRSYVARTQTDPPPQHTIYWPLPAREKRLAAIEGVLAALPARTFPAANDGFRAACEEVRTWIREHTPPAPSLLNPR